MQSEVTLASLAKSPTQTLTTRSSHVFMGIYAVFKLESLRLKRLINASRTACAELQPWRAAACGQVCHSGFDGDRPNDRNCL